MSGASGSLHGANLYVYCFNNPVNLTDDNGNWPSAKKIVEKSGGFVVKMYDSFIKSIEADVGIGFGFGANLSDNITAEAYRDTYVGIDDGEFVTGNKIGLEVSLFDIIGIGDSYNHLVQKGDKRVSNSGSALDGPFDMIFYPDVKRGNIITFLIFSVNSEGDFLVSLSASAHLGAGGSASIALNLSEYYERLFS